MASFRIWADVARFQRQCRCRRHILKAVKPFCQLRATARKAWFQSAPHSARTLTSTPLPGFAASVCPGKPATVSHTFLPYTCAGLGASADRRALIKPARSGRAVLLTVGSWMTASYRPKRCRLTTLLSALIICWRLLDFIYRIP